MEDAEFRNHAEKVIDKIVGGDFDSLKADYVYGSAYDRVNALEIDVLEACEDQGWDFDRLSHMGREFRINRYQENSTDIEAVIECYLTENGSSKYLEIDLVLIRGHISIEDVSFGA